MAKKSASRGRAKTAKKATSKRKKTRMVAKSARKAKPKARKASRVKTAKPAAAKPVKARTASQISDDMREQFMNEQDNVVIEEYFNSSGSQHFGI